MLRPLLVALVLSAPLAAQIPDPAPAISLPAEVKCKPGRLIRIHATTTGRLVRWVSPNEDCDLIPLKDDGRVVIFSATVPGRYRIAAYTAAADVPSEPAICVVIVGDPGPPPVPPGPGPNPPPVPPDPADPLTKELQAAFAADPGAVADKTKWRSAIAGFYLAMADHVKLPAVKTVADLLADYRAAMPSILPAEALPGTRKVAGLKVAAAVGDDATKALDAEFRGRLSDLFRRIAKALE